MTVIRPMRPESFAAYKAAEVAAFAEESVACGRWPAEGAYERSLTEFDELLPAGLATPNNHLFEILECIDGQAVGHLWFAIEERNGQPVAFIYDIEIDERHRRLGHAQRALIEFESVVRSLGLSRVSLHVSGQNPHAQALYSKLGFGVMGVSMSKQLPDESHEEVP